MEASREDRHSDSEGRTAAHLGYPGAAATGMTSVILRALRARQVESQKSATAKDKLLNVVSAVYESSFHISMFQNWPLYITKIIPQIHQDVIWRNALQRADDAFSLLQRNIIKNQCNRRLLKMFIKTHFFESFINYFSKHTHTPHLPIFPSFHIAADAWNQLPADIRTSSSLLKFKDSTRHYTGPGRQLPSVTTVAVSCSQIAYLGLLNYMCLLKLRSISPAKTSTFLSRKQRGLLISVCLQPCAVGDTRRESEMGERNLSPVEMSCSCDQCPSKVRLQRCIFSSDGSQDRQIMRSQPCQSQRMHCVWLRDRHRDHISLTSDCSTLPTLLISTPHQCRKKTKKNPTFRLGEK